MLLTVSNLTKHLPITRGILLRTTGHVRAVDGVSFTIDANQTLGLVGESGCGKSTVGRCILRLLDPTSGSVEIDGRDLIQLKGQELKAMRKKTQIIFQDSLSSLDPRMTIGSILEEPFLIHQTYPSKKERLNAVAQLLERVGLSSNIINRYPHEFSGGQCQRIGIARAIALRPSLIVADEPVSSLDVSVRAQIVNLLTDLQKEYGLSYLFISHDLSVVRHISNRIAVMYLGKIVELGTSAQICETPAHPYTKALLESIPSITRRTTAAKPLTGDIPSPSNPPPGCAFHTRCPVARPDCKINSPELLEYQRRLVRCPYV